MGKILAIVLAIIISSSMTPADSINVVQDYMTDLPASLESREDVVVEYSNSTALKITPNAVNWGHRGFIQISEDLIDYNSTVSFYMLTPVYPDGWCHRLPLVLSDAIGTVDQTPTMGGIVTNSNSGRTPESRGFGYYSYDSASGGTTFTYPDEYERIEFAEMQWFRVDMLVDFEYEMTEIYVDGVYYATASFSPDAYGYKGFKTFAVASGNYEQDFYVDEIVVREGLHEPEIDDIIALRDRNYAIEVDPSVVAYEPFDTVGSQVASTTSSWTMSVGYISGSGIDYQSSLAVKLPAGTTKFADAYIPLGDTTVEDNATVSFMMKTSYGGSKLPGLEIKLVDSSKNVLGGIVISSDSAKLLLDNGDGLYTVKDVYKGDLDFESDEVYSIDLLVNRTNNSLTVYVDQTRVGTVALENGALDGFDGILLSKQAGSGTKSQKVSFSAITVVGGLYDPATLEVLEANDSRLKVDVGAPKAVESVTDPIYTTPAPNDQETEPDATDTESGSCVSLPFGAVIAAAVGILGMGITVIKRK